MNFSKGILESRKQTYRHLKLLLKPIHLETPTRIELSPGNEIQVTLFDANHCTGAVMFLIEGNGKAILYTGDIRAEAWWIDSISRHPKLLPYTAASYDAAKRLDRIYFDTTFAVMEDPYREFPSKADGLRELLDKISRYPPNTRFYFHAWTFGYEDVWLALSQALNSAVHLDRYRYNIYMSLGRPHDSTKMESRDAPFLSGFMCGNLRQEGCITSDATSRLHSCEKGTRCQVFASHGRGTADDVVEIVPIISRHNGMDILELGAGGGKGDLDQTHELDIAEDPEAVMQLLALCKERIQDRTVLGKVEKMLVGSFQKHQGLSFDLNDLSQGVKPDMKQELQTTENGDDEVLPLVRIVSILSKLAISGSNPSLARKPRTITFPYSRHSSYNELRRLVSAFKPTDVYPCVVPPVQAWKEETMGMEVLFGDCCADPKGVRAWDKAMKATKFEWEMESRAIAELNGDRGKRGARDGTQKAEDTESEDGGEEFDPAPQNPMKIVGGRLEPATVIEEELRSSTPIKRPKQRVPLQAHHKELANEGLEKVAARSTEKEVGPVVMRKELQTTTPKPPPPPISTTTPLRRPSTREKIQSTRKRALDGTSHLSSAYRLKVRDAAYDAAVQGTWAQTRPRLSTIQVYDSDEEL